MKTTKLILCALSLFALTCFISCDEDDSKDNGGGSIDNPTDSKLTPDQHKEEIENIGKKFVAKFKSSDNEAIVKSLQDLEELISSSNFEEVFFPSENDHFEDTPAENLQKALASICSVITKNDIQALTRTATKADEYVWSEQLGIYTYDEASNEWSKKDADKIEIIYDSEKGASVFSATYSDVQHYTKNGEDIEVPGKINMTLKVGSQEELNLATNIKLSANQEALTADMNLTLSTHYKWTAKVDVNGGKGTINYKMTIRDEEVMSAIAEINGTKMTDPDYVEDNEDNLDQVFSTTKISYSIMDITLAGEADLKAIISAADKLDDSYSWDDEEADKEYEEKSSQIFNDYAKIAMYYTAKSEKIADIKMKASWEESYYDEFKDWYSSPILVFASDDSELAIEDFFTETRFSSFISAVEDLANEFADMLDLEHVEL